MWEEADKAVIKQLESAGELYCAVRFYCVFRKGYLLLALPKERDLALAALSLYQPQAWKARSLVACIRLLVKFKLHTFFLPSRQLDFRRQGPIAALRANDEGFGFLLGNPASEARRVILARKTSNELVIDKVGLSTSAREAVSAEVSIIQGLPDGLSGLLELRQYDANDDWSFYSCPMVNGKSPERRHDDLVIKVLRSWFHFAQKTQLKGTVQWSTISDFIELHDMKKARALLAECKYGEVMMGINHGDFAPWNIKVTASGRVVVMDWEYGTCRGPAAWDWIHYLLQRSLLVEHMSNRQAIQGCRDWANSDRGKVFMEAAGWGGNIECCIGSYLVYSNALGRFEHEGLLAAWINE